MGFVHTKTLAAYKWCTNAWWTDTEALQTLPLEDLVAVHKMWVPLLPFYNEQRAFHITTDEAPLNRYECQPSSCWRVETVNYDGRKTAVKEQMRACKRSDILMSNSREFLLCAPSSSGWATETILNYDVLPLEEVARTSAEHIADLLVSHIGQTDGLHGWSVMAHALFSAYSHIGGQMKVDDLSHLPDGDIHALKQYERDFLKRMSK